MRKFLPLLLVLVVLGSGCTVPILNIEIPGLPDIPGFGGPTVVQYEHDIIVIESLEAIPAEIDAGQTTKIVAFIKNLGDKPVNDVKVSLYDYCEGLFEIKDVDCEGSYGSGTLGKDCTIREMLSLETARVVWTLSQDESSPVSLRTICPPDGMKVSVTYPYTTSSLTTISFISKEELERTLEERAYQSTDSYIVVGQGPIKPYLTVEDKQPIPVFSGARTMVQLVLKNAGSGQLASKIRDGDKEVPGISSSKVSVEGIGGSSDLMAETGGECHLGSTLSKNVRFIGKESSPLTCKIDLSRLDVAKTATRHIEVTVKEYEYTFTKSVQVVVNPKFAD